MSFSDWVTGCDDYLYESRVAHAFEYRVVRSAVAADGDYVLRVPERNSWIGAQCLKLRPAVVLLWCPARLLIRWDKAEGSGAEVLESDGLMVC